MKGKQYGKRLLAVCLALVMLLSAAPLTGLAAQAEEWTAAVESAVVAREEADVPTSFGTAVKNTIASIGRALQSSVTLLGQQSLQRSSAISQTFTGGGNAVVGQAIEVRSQAAEEKNAQAQAAKAAEIITSGDYQYRALSDGTAEIMDYWGQDTELTIPSEIDGYQVTSIMSEAFRKAYLLMSVTIPASVTSIAGNVFSNCYQLTDVNVDPQNTAYRSENGVLFSKDGTILQCYPSEKIDKSYIIPRTVTNIGERAFYGCELLSNVTIPDSVTSIGEYAFYGCELLSSVTIPDSVTDIGHQAFSNSFCLKEIIVDPENATYSSEDGILFNKDKSLLILCPMGKRDTNYKIPEGVVRIEEYAFSCSFIDHITIPSSVESIGNDAFFSPTPSIFLFHLKTHRIIRLMAY